MQLMLLPMLGPAPAERSWRNDADAPVLDMFVAGLAVAYSFGPPYGQHFATYADLDRLELPRRALRRHATDGLDRLASFARVHGRPPALMLSCNGFESSLLLADHFWARAAATVPGELVAGVPARDVVIFTGSLSRPGVAKVRRAVDRVFYAGGPHLLTPNLLVYRQGRWQPLEDAADPERVPVGAPAPPAPPVQPPAPAPYGGPRSVPRQWQQPGRRVTSGRRW